MNTEDVHGISEFEWDLGNDEKNLLKHGVSCTEAEEVFFNEPLLLFEDVVHSGYEPRQYCLGQTDVRRKLFIAFTLRKNKIRAISARNMSRNERIHYEQD